MLLVGESLILPQVFLRIVKLSFHSLFGVTIFFYSTPYHCKIIDLITQ